MSSGRIYRDLAISLIAGDLVKRGWTQASGGPSRIWTFTSPEGYVWTTSASTLLYPFITPALMDLAKDKTQAQQYVAQLGVEVPATLEAASVDEAALDFLYSQRPIVVKPSDGFGSRGVQLGVMHPEQLVSAVTAATQYSPRVLLQRQFIGEEIRLTVIDGVVRSILMKQTAQVVGDGQRTIAELLVQENKERADIPTSLLSYPALSQDMVDVVAERMNEVVPAGEVCKVGSSSLVSKGACLYELIETTDVSYKNIAATIATTLDAPFLIVDLLVHDYQQPATTDNYVFLEINTSPALKMYYGARNQLYYDIVPELGALIERHYRNR